MNIRNIAYLVFPVRGLWDVDFVAKNEGAAFSMEILAYSHEEAMRLAQEQCPQSHSVAQAMLR